MRIDDCVYVSTLALGALVPVCWMHTRTLDVGARVLAVHALVLVMLIAHARTGARCAHMLAEPDPWDVLDPNTIRPDVMTMPVIDLWICLILIAAASTADAEAAAAAPDATATAAAAIVIGSTASFHTPPRAMQYRDLQVLRKCMARTIDVRTPQRQSNFPNGAT